MTTPTEHKIIDAPAPSKAAIAALERVSRWLNDLEVPTDGCTAQMTRVMHVIDWLDTLPEAVVPIAQFRTAKSDWVDILDANTATLVAEAQAGTVEQRTVYVAAPARVANLHQSAHNLLTALQRLEAASREDVKRSAAAAQSAQAREQHISALAQSIRLLVTTKVQ